MKSTIIRQISLSIVLFITFTNLTYAEATPNLPVSTQITDELHETVKIEEVEIIPEIIIQTGTSNENKNPNLKEGEACDDQDLDSATLSPDVYQDIPMAKTIPCDKVNCEDLKAARLMKDSYKKIPMAKTTKLKPCVKK